MYIKLITKRIEFEYKEKEIFVYISICKKDIRFTIENKMTVFGALFR